MPETPIDQSDRISSIRLKVPTGTVPIPPAGYAQLHSPSPGTLALRLPDGSVVEIGAAAGAPRSIAGTGGGVNADSAPGIIDGLTIAVPPGKHLWLNVPDVLFGPDQRQFGVQVSDPVTITAAELKAASFVDKVAVAAHGSDRIIAAQMLCFDYRPGLIPYAVEAGALLVVGYAPDPATNNAGSLQQEGCLDQADGFFSASVPTPSNLRTVFANRALVITRTGAAPTLGDGVVVVTAAYLVV